MACCKNLLVSKSNVLSFSLGAVLCSAVWFFAADNAPHAETEDASVQILQERLRELGPVSSSQRKALADEMLRVRQYEKKLRTRASALENMLDGVIDLDRERETSATLEDVSIQGDLAVGAEYQLQAVALSSRSNPGTGAARTRIEVERQETLHLIDRQLERLARTPIGAPTNARISSGFGYRRSPFSRRVHFHKGIDFAGDMRSKVVATAEGTVVKARYFGAYGYTVIIDHGNGLKTLYGHLSKITVIPGQQVARGERIGLLGSTGRSTGPHVHYEIRHKDRPINPIPFVELVTFLGFV